MSFSLIPLTTSGLCMADVLDTVNLIRERGCGTGAGVTPPLRAEERLHTTARRLAGGSELGKALAESGYRARSSTSIYLRAPGQPDIARLLAEHYCETIVDLRVGEVGLFGRDDEVWIVLADPYAPPAPESDTGVAVRVIELINEARRTPRSCGQTAFPAAPPLKPSPVLERAAQAHALDMASSSHLDHSGSDGSSPAQRASSAGYRWQAVAENIAAGASTPDAVVAGWLASPGHCANLMDAGFGETGVAFSFDPDSDKGTYWVQVFATPM